MIINNFACFKNQLYICSEQIGRKNEFSISKYFIEARKVYFSG
jgi:hypothetical protein